MFEGDDVDPVIIWGEEAVSGAYVLRIGVEQPLHVHFGRYREGRAIAVPAGRLVYVGSAMGRKGSTTLARRLLRHATRSEGRPPHGIRDTLLGWLQEAGLAPAGVRPPATKRLHWHVDYLLDEGAATLEAVLVIRSVQREEGRLAELLGQSPHTAPLAPGLGAADAPGSTHLLRLDGGEGAWREMLRTLHAAGLDGDDDGDAGAQDQEHAGKDGAAQRGRSRDDDDAALGEGVGQSGDDDGAGGRRQGGAVGLAA